MYLHDIYLFVNYLYNAICIMLPIYFVIIGDLFLKYFVRYFCVLSVIPIREYDNEQIS